MSLKMYISDVIVINCLVRLPIRTDGTSYSYFQLKLPRE